MLDPLSVVTFYELISDVVSSSVLLTATSRQRDGVASLMPETCSGTPLTSVDVDPTVGFTTTTTTIGGAAVDVKL